MGPESAKGYLRWLFMVIKCCKKTIKGFANQKLNKESAPNAFAKNERGGADLAPGWFAILIFNPIYNYNSQSNLPLYFAIRCAIIFWNLICNYNFQSDYIGGCSTGIEFARICLQSNLQNVMQSDLDSSLQPIPNWICIRLIL